MSYSEETWRTIVLIIISLTEYENIPHNRLQVNVVVLLALKFEELSWDYAKPSQENNEDCLPCLFIQFCVIENGRRVSKILQVDKKNVN